MMDQLFSFFGLFQVTCFIFLVRYITKLFKRYVSPLIKEMLHQQEEEQKKQEQQYQGLQEHYARAQATLEEHKETAKRLLIKIAIWHKVQQEKELLIKQERKHSQEQVKKHLELQSHWLTLLHARATILPEALALTNKKITKQFHASNKQKQFLDELCTFFTQRVS